MEIVPTRLPEVMVIKPRVFGDERGFFFETWHEQKFAVGGIPTRFVQDNHSHSTRHTLRGLHFQIEQPQGKLVRVTRGEVFDVCGVHRRASGSGWGRCSAAAIIRCCGSRRGSPTAIWR
jgi:dTDP-4-dehydrorhamnose 3,5-epimerase